MDSKAITMLSDLQRANKGLQLLHCPFCRKSMAEHSGGKAMRCLTHLAEEDRRKFEEYLIKRSQ